MKVVGRTPTALRVAEYREGPSIAKELTVTCLACGKIAFVKFWYGITPEQRAAAIKEAADMHRKACKVGVPEDGRRYAIGYPRA